MILIFSHRSWGLFYCISMLSVQTQSAGSKWLCFNSVQGVSKVTLYFVKWQMDIQYLKGGQILWKMVVWRKRSWLFIVVNTLLVLPKDVSWCSHFWCWFHWFVCELLVYRQLGWMDTYNLVKYCTLLWLADIQ